MRRWKRSNVQAVRSIARLIIAGGLFVVIFHSKMELNVVPSLLGLPSVLPIRPFGKVLFGATIIGFGCAMAIRARIHQ